MGGLMAKNFPWPSTIGGSQAVNPLVSSGPPQTPDTTNPGMPSSVANPPQPSPPTKPPLTPQPISNMMRANPSPFYGR